MMTQLFQNILFALLCDLRGNAASMLRNNSADKYEDLSNQLIKIKALVNKVSDIIAILTVIVIVSLLIKYYIMLNVICHPVVNYIQTILINFCQRCVYLLSRSWRRLEIQEEPNRNEPTVSYSRQEIIFDI